MAREINIVLSVTGAQAASDAIDDVNKSLADTKAAAPDAGGSFDKLSSSIQGVVVAYAGMKGIQAVEQLYTLGTEVNRVSSVFDTFGAKIKVSQADLGAFSAATGGIVGNMDLMKDASKLMSLGLVQNSSDIQKITGDAVHLGEAFGKDAQSSIQTFTTVLQNHSARALQQFGVSSDEVNAKAKMFESTIEGISKNDAFRMAVLDVAGAKVKELGAAADAAETPFARLQVTIKNIGDEFAGRFTQGVNGVIGILQFAAGATPQQQQQQSKITDQAAQILPMVQKGMDIQGDLNPILDFTHKAIQAAIADPSLAQDATRLTQTVLSQMGTSADDLVKKGDLHFGSAFDDLNNNQVFEQLASAALQYKGTLDQVATSTQQVAAATASVQSTVMGGAAAGGGGSKATSGMGFSFGGGDKSYSWNQMASGFATAAGQQEAQLATARQQQVYNWVQDAIRMGGKSEYTPDYFANLAKNSMNDASKTSFLPGMASGLMNSFTTQAQGVQGVGQFGTLDQANKLAATYNDINAKFQHLQDLNKQGLISDDDLSKAQGLRDSVKATADDAARAVDNLNNMSIKDFTGQGSGGLQGQLEDQVLAAMKKAGVRGSTLTATQSALDLQSGRTTQTSGALDSAMQSLAGMKLDPATMAQAVANLTSFMQFAQTQNLTDAQKAAMLPGAAGVSGTGKNATAGGFDAAAYYQQQMFAMSGGGAGGGKTDAGNSQGFKRNADGSISFAGSDVGGAGGGKDMSSMSAQSQATLTNVTAISTAMASSKSSAENFASALARTPSSKKITISFDVNDPNNVLSLLNIQGLGGGQPATAGTTGTMNGSSGNKLG